MARIITVSREFASGGRELAKRMADALGWDYYDREIIDKIAAEQGMNAEYVDRALSNHDWRSVKVNYRRSFAGLAEQRNNTDLLVKEREIIRRIAASGQDCIIVGRNADVYLKDQKPFRLFVCAEMPARIARCRQRLEDGAKMSDKEVRRNILRVDKGRMAIRELVAGNPWGERASYHLTVNTTDWDLDLLAASVAHIATTWFAAPEKERDTADEAAAAFEQYGE